MAKHYVIYRSFVGHRPITRFERQKRFHAALQKGGGRDGRSSAAMENVQAAGAEQAVHKSRYTNPDSLTGLASERVTPLMYSL